MRSRAARTPAARNPAPRTLSVLILGVLILAAPVLTGPGTAQAQSPAPVAETAEGRVLFAPLLGARVAEDRGACWLPGGPSPCPPGGASNTLSLAELRRWPGGLRVQNGGAVATRFLATYYADVSEAGCDCRLSYETCSPPVAPGETWFFPGFPARLLPTATLAANVVVLSLNDRPARDYGPAFAAYLEAQGHAADTTLADLACPAVETALAPSGVSPVRVGPADAAPLMPDAAPPTDSLAQAGFPCDNALAFQTAYLSGGHWPPAPELPVAPFRGEPIAGVAASPIEVTAGSLPNTTLDRYALLGLAETGAPAAGGQAAAYLYQAPGAYLRPPDGQTSVVVLQNAGPACAAVTVTAFETNRGPVEGNPYTLEVPAGGRRAVDLGALWPVASAATVQVASDSPLAVLLVNRGHVTSAASPALPVKAEAQAWALPLAYQEARENLVTAGARAPQALRLGDWRPALVPDGLAQDEGFGSYVSVFNPAEETRELRLWTQTTGRPAREVLYPLRPLAQTVFQLGFGLGLPGGPGWGRFDLSAPNVAIAAETQRTASDHRGAVLESWMTPAWGFRPGLSGPRTVLLPDLGGPAVGATGIAAARPGAGITTTLMAQIAVQNLVTATARVALDGYADCGYAGTLIREIDPRQALRLPVTDLTGTALGANAAVLRVLAGEVAVLAEMTRPERQTTVNYAPDQASAYLGTRFEHSLPAPRVVVSPTELTLTLPPAPEEAPPLVGVSLENASRACHRLQAHSDAAWLLGAVGEGAIPGQVTVVVAPERLPPGGRHVGQLLLDADPPGAAGLPAVVTVTVLGQGGPAALYLPFAQRVR